MTQDNTGEDQINQNGNDTLQKLVFPDEGRKTYLRSPAFYLVSSNKMAEFKTNILDSKGTLIARVVLEKSFECPENSKKHFSRCELKTINEDAATLAPGTYTIELDESVLGSVDKTETTFEVRL